uniref:Tf2-1-like SH3-like domain-containing protein n=1 Tax=Triticum urartu TaxID=4572 RepID=A0A8R7PSC5_TRIUA
MDSIHQHLLRAQQRMKAQADKHRTERTFAVGDSVFLKLQPYLQSSVAPRANHKLAFKFYGPFRILARVGEVSYELDLPATSRVHPVFHVSLLKRVLASDSQVLPHLAPPDAHLQIPEQVLQQRVVRRGNNFVVQVLFRWSDSSAELATWKDKETLKHMFS